MQNLAGKLHESSRSFSASFSRSFCTKSREEKKGLRELMRNLAEFSLRKFTFENFCSRSEREKKSFFLGLICTWIS